MVEEISDGEVDDLLVAKEKWMHSVRGWNRKTMVMPFTSMIISGTVERERERVITKRAGQTEGD